MSGRATGASATLARLGLDADALGAGRTPAADVAPLLAGPDGPALAAALGALTTPAVAALLVALEAGATGGVRREIRRALYRLRQRGVAVPAAPPAPPPARAAAEPPVEGFVSAFDGRGDRLVWLVRPQAAGGVLLVAAQLNEPGGLADVHLGELGRKALRAARERLEHEARVRLVPADWRVLDALLVEAHARVGGGERERERDYLRVRPRLTAAPPASPAEPVSARVAAPAGAEGEALLAASAALLGEPEFRTWWPSLEALAPFVDELAAARESPLVVSRAAEADRVREVIGRAAGTLVPPPTLARRLAGTAYVLAESGRGAAARQALAVAAALGARPSEAASVPFVAAWVERALGELLAETAARRDEERRGSLIKTPGEVLRERESSRPQRTRG